MTTTTLASLPLFLNRLGAWEIIIIVLVGLLLFGTKRIPELMRNMGKGVHAFKQGVEDAKAEINKPVAKGVAQADKPEAQAAEADREPVAAKDKSE